MCPSSVKTASSPFGVDPTFIVGSNVYDGYAVDALPETGGTERDERLKSPRDGSTPWQFDESVGEDAAEFAVSGCITEGEFERRAVATT